MTADDHAAYDFARQPLVGASGNGDLVAALSQRAAEAVKSKKGSGALQWFGRLTHEQG